MQVPIDHHEAEVICSDMALSAAATEFRETLDAIDITQRHAARLFGVSPRHIRRWRSGSRRLPHAARTNGNAKPGPPAPLKEARHRDPLVGHEGGDD